MLRFRNSIAFPMPPMGLTILDKPSIKGLHKDFTSVARELPAVASRQHSRPVKAAPVCCLEAGDIYDA
jgi:hypothetical protein